MNEKRKHINRKGTEYKKAAYPKTDAAEVTAIKIFEGLIDENRVKTHIAKRDKYPNTDGYIEPVDAENRSIGTIHVQVKTLSDADIKRGGYSSDEGFLGHCKDALEPSILVGVDIQNEIAYWNEVTAKMVENLEKEGSLTVKLPVRNVISKSEQNYYESWVIILNNRKQVIKLFSELEDDAARIRLVQKILSENLGGIRLDDDINVEKIQEFLDEYNNLMSSKFRIISRLYYPNARKYGFAYTHYDEKHLSYVIYEIPKDSTDLDIKKIPDSFIDKMVSKGLRAVTHFGINPVETDPRTYAQELVREDLIHIIERGGLGFKNDYLARELIFDILNKSHYKFGLEKKDKYTIDEILFGFNKFLPRWIINIINLCNDSQRQGHKNSYTSKQYFDINSADILIPKATVDKVHDITIKQIADNSPFMLNFPIGHDDYPINLFLSSLEDFRNRGVIEVERLYPKYDYNRNRQSRWIYKWLAPADLLSKVKTYFAYLPIAFNSIIHENFPMLEDKFHYASDFNRQVVKVVAHEECNEMSDWPSIIYFNLLCLDENHEITIDVYMEDDKSAPQLDYSKFDKEIIIDSKRYRLVSSSNLSADIFFNPLPLYRSILKLLKVKSGALFDEWNNEKHS